MSRRDPNEPDTTIDREAAEALAAKLMAASADLARTEAAFLDLLAEFDTSGAIRWWNEDASLAAWLSRICGVAPGTAREHVRIARALKQMPDTRSAYQDGEISYSKVRELTRLADTHDEAPLLQLARHATASQLARTVQAYRAHTGSHQDREQRTRLTWTTRDDGLVRITATLLPEHGAAVVNALEACTDLHLADGQGRAGSAVGSTSDSSVTDEPPHDVAESFPEQSRRSRIQALVEIANHWLNTHPADRNGEDRTTVLVEVSTEHLHAPLDDDHDNDQGHERDLGHDAAPVNDPGTTTAASSPTATQVGDLRSERCWVRGFGNLEPATARRLCCEADIQAILTDPSGEPLHVGRTQRFGTRAQRRALMLRDQHCAFPACHRVRHLKIHHIISWLDDGPTDLENLMLLCQHHHTMVHEAGITITTLTPTERDSLAGVRWIFSRPDETVIVPENSGHQLLPALPHLTDVYGEPLTGTVRQAALAERDRLLAEYDQSRKDTVERQNSRRQVYQQIRDLHHPAASTIRTIGGGEGFNLHNCAEVLFNARTDRSGTGGRRDEEDRPAAA